MLFGVDIDPEAPQRVRDSGLEIQGGNLKTGDLLALDPEDLGGLFEAIVGNPPYVRHHRLTEELARRGRESGKRLGIELNGRSDAWAYFCAHLTSFLSDSGRLALVLPGSVLHADYAEPLLAALRSGRGETQLIRLRRRVFPQVQERTVILLVDRSAPDREELVPRQLADVEQLRRSLKVKRRAVRPKADPRSKKTSRSTAKSQLNGLGDPQLPWRLTRDEARIYEQICVQTTVCALGDLATVRIGVVTGANEFFVRTPNDIEALGEEVDSLPIVARGGWLQRPHWKAADQRKVSDKPSRLLLLDPTRTYEGDLAEQIRRAEELGIAERHHCSKREPWYTITDRGAPQLFLPYMGSTPPRLIINDSGATCTNSIHRVRKHASTKATIREIAAGSWTTLFALAAEIEGRSYGGGVLKVEPGGAAKAVLPLGAQAELLDELTLAFEEGGVEMARALADQHLLIDQLGLTQKELDLLRSATRRLREQRQQ